MKKVALITGSSRGIGAATAIAFAKRIGHMYSYLNAMYQYTKNARHGQKTL